MPTAGQAPVEVPLKPVATIPLPGVRGRIDHLAFDAPRQHLFVAALGNDTVEVIDTATRQHLRSLPGFREPQGIAAVPDANAVAVANGNTGTLQLVDAQTFQTRWTVTIGDDADNVRYDGAARRLYVAAVGGLFAVDPADGRVVQHIAIAGHPESFQLEVSGRRIFANLPGASEVAVSDRQTGVVTARWPTQTCGGNYPMGLAEAAGRLFIGCRRPARLGMLNVQTGASVASADIVGDTDDLFYDEPRRLIYVIGGEGFVDVLRQDGDALQRVARVPTRAGARTGLWVPDQGALYVAVPVRGGDSAELRILDGN
jgi:YVTN family beta-propeller protein